MPVKLSTAGTLGFGYCPGVAEQQRSYCCRCMQLVGSMQQLDESIPAGATGIIDIRFRTQQMKLHSLAGFAAWLPSHAVMVKGITADTGHPSDGDADMVV